MLQRVLMVAIEIKVANQLAGQKGNFLDSSCGSSVITKVLKSGRGGEE